jgi:hypothetical protein
MLCRARNKARAEAEPGRRWRPLPGSHHDEKEWSRSMEGDDFSVSRAAIAVVLLGALLGVIGAGMIWGPGGVLLFVGTVLLAFGLTGK